MMAVRDRVKRHVVRNTAELYQAVLNEVNTVKRLLDAVKRTPERSTTMPPCAAQAYRARTLSRRLEATWAVLQRAQVRRAATQLPLVRSSEMVFEGILVERRQARCACQSSRRCVYYTLSDSHLLFR
jgi:Dynein heavy chain, N-terminal region 1